MLPELNIIQWLLVAGAAFTSGLSKSGIIGLGMVSVILMAGAMEPLASTGALLLLLIAADVLAVAVYRKEVDWKIFLKILPPALIGIVAGYLVMERIDQGTFKLLMGWLILAMVALHFVNRALGDRLEAFVSGHGFAWPMGILGGVTTMLANAAGPVMTLYFLALKLPKMRFVGTVAMLFFIINLFKVPFSSKLGLIHTDTLWMALVTLPLVAAGFWIGRALVVRLPQKVFEIIALVLSAIGGLRLIYLYYFTAT